MGNKTPAGLLMSASECRLILDERLPFGAMTGLAVDYFESAHIRLKAVYSVDFLRRGGNYSGAGIDGVCRCRIISTGVVPN